MASIRRTLSPVPRPGSLANGDACAVASPLSRSSSCNLSHLPSSGLLSPFGFQENSLCRVQAFLLGLFPLRFSRSQDRPKIRGQLWRRALSHFFICFVVGAFVGITPFVSLNLSANLLSKHQAFFFDVNPTIENFQVNGFLPKNITPLVDKGGMDNNLTVGLSVPERDRASSTLLFSQLPNHEMNARVPKPLLIVTPTYSRPLQAYYLNRLAHVLKVVPPPLLWIVVEMTMQSIETADVLRNTGVMYRHLVCSKNSSKIKDRAVQQRNVALSHIETHRLDGIVHFADDDNVYAADLFNQMRQIRRLGTWKVAKLVQGRKENIFEGPICNGARVIGWHTNGAVRRLRRFHACLSGFAFNSSILWDPKGWHRPTLEPIRQIDTVEKGFQVSTLIEQIVEDESQMEGLPPNCSAVMVWNLNIESSFPYPQEWFIKNNLPAMVPLPS